MTFPEKYRVSRLGYESKCGDRFGWFLIPARCANGRVLRCLADEGSESGWEHVSVSIDDPKHPEKCPSWPEMCIAKAQFWDRNECVVQYHPAAENYVNFHPGVLHLWRQRGAVFPMPPKVCV